MKIALPGDNLRGDGTCSRVIISTRTAARGQPDLLVTSGVIKKAEAFFGRLACCSSEAGLEVSNEILVRLQPNG